MFFSSCFTSLAFHSYVFEVRMFHTSLPALMCPLMATGLTYFMYKHLKKCHIRPIENITSSGDVMVNNNGTVSLLPPWMFEDLDGPWQYNGIVSLILDEYK